MSTEETTPGAGAFIGRELACATCGANSFTIADLEPVRCPVCGALKMDSYAVRPEWQTDAARQWKRKKLGADFLEWPVWLRRAWLHLLREATARANAAGATLEDLPAEGVALALETVRIPAHAAYVPRVAIDAEAAAWTPPAESYLTAEDAECLAKLIEWRRARDGGARMPRFQAANAALTPGVMDRLRELVEAALNGERR